MSSNATAEQLCADIFAGDQPANDDWVKPSHDALRAQGYLIGFGKDIGITDYRSDPCTHLSLTQSLAKKFLKCPDDAWRIHPKGGGEREKPSKAMEESNFFDSALTGEEGGELDEGLKQLIATDMSAIAADQPKVWRRAFTKFRKGQERGYDEVTYNDWQGFRIIEADDFRSAVVKQCRDDGLKQGLTPMLQKQFVKRAEEAATMRIRLELAGIDLRRGQRQVPIFWVEFADDEDHTPVQCRGLLDQLEENGRRYTIRDLKAVKSLDLRDFARQVYTCGWHIQNAAYTSGVEKITGEYGRVSFEWAAVRKGDLPAAARRKADGYLLDSGRNEWRCAVNGWAKCLKTGLFPGYELAGLETVHAEPWMLSRTEELLAAFELHERE